MSNISDVHTVEELVTFISSFIETVPTQDDLDSIRNDMLTKDALSGIVAKLVYRSEFVDALGAKASKADLVQSVASKAEQSDVSTGIARKANLSALYNLEAKVSKLFPFVIVDTISDRDSIAESARNKIVMVLDASADPQLSSDANGAMYGWSTAQRRWIMQSEIKYNGDQIKYNAILGRPSASAAEIDTAVSSVINNIGLIRRIREVFANMHTHTSTTSQIDAAVTSAHSHPGLPEILSLNGNELITVVKDGQLVNVKASVLKQYIQG